MSCPNFETQVLFPLYAMDDEFCFEVDCDECGEWVYRDEWEEKDCCPFCGCKTHGETQFNEWLWYDEIELLQGDCKEQNENLQFFEITTQSGYSCGEQLFVRLTDNANYAGFYIDGDTEAVTNEEAHYYFDCCRSKCIRRFEREQRKVLKLMEQIASRHNMECSVSGAIMSNGECFYYKADSLIGAAKSA